MKIEVWLMFSTVAFLNIISPGPAVLLAVSNGATAGLRTVSISALGNLAGLLVLSSVSMFGLGAVLQASVTLFTIVKLSGAAYLVYLGVKKFKTAPSLLSDESAKQKQSHGSYTEKFREGLMIAITNPKAILFFVALFPLFLDLKTPVLPQFFIMTMTFMGISFLSLISYGFLGNRVRHWFVDAKILKTFHRVTGGMFILLGIGLLQVKNHSH